jgi:hypothetical protein
MAAYEIPNLRFSGVAEEAITRRRFVKPTSDTGYAMTDAGEVAVGASMNDPANTEVLEIADGIVMVEAGEEITVGMEIQSGANGVAIELAAGIKLGTALTPGLTGELVTIKTIV